MFDHDYCSPNEGLSPNMQPSSKAQIDCDLNTGGREKRKRKELYDPEFSRFTSSEYSSSEAESDEETGADSEDDPERPWCACNKPHNGEFMIQCDICKYWYHGKCVGVTETMSSKYESQGKEWFCPDCHYQLKSGTERNAIPLRLVKKEKKKTSGKSNRTGKRGRGRPRKSEPVKDIATRMSTRNARKSTSVIEKFGAKKKMDVRSESFEEFENNEKLKMLIRERKKQFFYKRSLAEQQKRAKMQELGLISQSVTTPSLGNSLDSLATSTSTPNMNNLPINIKSDNKERFKPNIVLQINTKKDGSSDHDSQRIVTAIVKKRKHSEAKEPVATGSPGVDLAPLIKTPKIASAPLNKTPKVEPAPSNKALKVTPPLSNKTIGVEAAPVDKIPKLDIALINTKPKLDSELVSKMPTVEPTPLSKIPKVDSAPVSKISAVEPAPLIEIPKVETRSLEKIFNAEPTPLNKISKDSADEPCWNGLMNVPEVGKFSVLANTVSGNVSFMKEELGQNLVVCGRIAPDQVTSYIKKLKSTTKNQVLLIQLHPQTNDDKANFDIFFDYLYSRNRCAVITTGTSSHILKDFYILPIHEKSSIPEVLRPIEGPGLDRKRNPNCLLGLLVRGMRPTSSSSSTSNCTPTPTNK